MTTLYPKDLDSPAPATTPASGHSEAVPEHAASKDELAMGAGSSEDSKAAEAPKQGDSGFRFYLVCSEPDRGFLMRWANVSASLFVQ